MADTLLDAIDRALSGQLDEREFERYALFAIGEMYPTIVPVEGGSDLGQDGIALDEHLEPIVLCTTIGTDVIGNLRKNLDRYLAEGGRARQAFMATNQKLSARRIRNLEDAAADRGMRLLQVFQHGWFHRHLYKDAGWRLSLLGLAGEPPALSLEPESRRLQIDVPLVGRDGLRAELEELGGDLILYGEPGSGKTSLLADLVRQGWGRFAIDDDRGRLADALREFSPARVVVDDAHLRPDRLALLLHLRQHLGIPFQIVATSWPNWVPGPEAAMPTAEQRTVQPLTRDEMLQVIESLGLTGHIEFQRSVIDQSLGRPGLAATLVSALLSGKTREVWMGDAILEDVAGTIGGRLGPREDLAALGVLSLSHDDGLTASELASLLGKDLLWVNDFLRRVASGGTIESRQASGDERALRVQPAALRFALAHDTFASDRAVLSASQLVQRMPRPAAAATPLVYSLHRGARSLAPLVQRLVAAGGVDPATLGAYASLGSREASEALAVAPAAHAAEIAIAAADAAPKVAVSTLLELSVGDDRPRNSHPEHPMRQLGDYLQRQRDPLERRLAVGQEIRRWLAAGGDPVPAVEALSLVLLPGVGGLEMSPGSTRAGSIWSGAVAWPSLKRLAPFWDDLIQMARDPHVRIQGPILNVLGEWLFPGRVMIGGASAGQSWYREVRRVGRSVAERLGAALVDRPGQLQALRRTARHARVRILHDVADDFAACYPDREFFDGGYTAEKQARLERRWDRDAEAVANQWLGMPVRQVAERLAWIEQEAREAGLSYPRASTVAVTCYATHHNRPLAALRAFAAARVPADLQQPLVERLFNGRRGLAATLRALMDDPTSSEATAWVCLNRPVDSATLNRAIEIVQDWPRWEYDGSARSIRRFTPAAQLALLTCPNRETRRAAVRAIAADHASGVPAEVEGAWRAAIPETRSDYWLEEALLKEPQLLAAWTRAWGARADDPEEPFESFPDKLLPAVKALPADVRRELLVGVGARKSMLIDEVVARLITDDLETVEVLFTQERTRFQRAALSGELDEGWLRRAAIARRAGWSAERIVAAQITGVGVMTIAGPESAFWESKAEEFRARLRDTDGESARELWRAGVAICEADRDRALAEERREAVYGFDR